VSDLLLRVESVLTSETGGTSGCLLAHRLASSKSQPTVALLEGGESIPDIDLRRTYERFSLVFQNTELDYGYMSAPQAPLNGRVVPQSRGKGLGGSSAVNFQVWSLGAKPEFDTWAKATGDDAWGFESVLERVKMVRCGAILVWSHGLTLTWMSSSRISIWTIWVRNGTTTFVLFKRRTASPGSCISTSSGKGLC
jgi:choline dehydrogenase-like flavoprotein